MEPVIEDGVVVNYKPKTMGPLPRVDEECIKMWATLRPTLPKDWRSLREAKTGGKWTTPGSMTIIASLMWELDNRMWLHVSCARRSRLPSWEELSHVKAGIIGDRTALQVFPTKDKYVNEHPFCLHLWCCLTDEVTPDFTRGLGLI